MNTEPVAWILNGIIHEFDPNDWAKEQYPDQDVIPLYTHPLKELADEEIKSEAKYFCHSYYLENPERLVLFARAILRKAQEK